MLFWYKLAEETNQFVQTIRKMERAFIRFRVIATLLTTFLLYSPQLFGQTKWLNPLQQSTDIIRGRYWGEELKNNYSRLPDRAKESVRSAVWDMSRHSAGLSIAFQTNAKHIYVKYTFKGDKSSYHQAAIGASGVDMYAIDINGYERWCAPNMVQTDTTYVTFSNLTYSSGADRGYEFHLYLPPFVEIEHFEIGIPQNTGYFEFLPYPGEKPIVIYGTSIVHGACASRPGLAWSNIVERELQHPVINLGFAGNGQMEKELFSLINEIDAKLYIIDCMPNLSQGDRYKTIFNRTIAGVKQIRSKHNTPILLVEHSGYMNDGMSLQNEISYREANAELRRAYKHLQNEGIQEIYYLTKEEIGFTVNSMVEGIHPNDIGMMQYANACNAKIREILDENPLERSVFSPLKQQRDSYNWNKRHEEILKLNKERAPQIVLIGNSITHYWSGLPESGRAVNDESWNTLFKGKEVRNMAFGWDRIENALWRIYHGELDGYNAEKVFLLMGTNNLEMNTDNEVVDGINELVRAVRKRQPTAKIYVCGIIPRSWQEPRVEQVNNLIKARLLTEEATFVPMDSEFVQPNGRIINEYFSDGLHPNKDGYIRMAKMLEKYVNE